MNQNQELINRFYTAFQQRDWKTMQQCYHPESQFSDPAFPGLNYVEVKAMWHMLCENAKDFSLQFSDVTSNGDQGSCNWQAWYTFSLTGRKVHNIIKADFHFKDGLIVKHTDTFNFWRWSRMAMGVTGSLLGWTPFFRSKVQATARKSLTRFMKQHALYSI
jgi:uncharacterized protein